MPLGSHDVLPTCISVKRTKLNDRQNDVTSRVLAVVSFVLKLRLVRYLRLRRNVFLWAVFLDNKRGNKVAALLGRGPY